MLRNKSSQGGGGGGEVNGGGVHFQVNLAVPGLRRELKSQASDSLPPAEA